MIGRVRARRGQSGAWELLATALELAAGTGEIPMLADQLQVRRPDWSEQCDRVVEHGATVCARLLVDALLTPFEMFSTVRRLNGVEHSPGPILRASRSSAGLLQAR